MNKILLFFNNLNIKNKLIISFLIVSIIPTTFIGLISYNISSDIVKEMRINESIYELSNVNEKVNQLLKNKELIAIKFSLDRNLYDLLSNRSIDQSQYIKKTFDLDKMLYDYRYTEQTHSIYIFDNNDKIYTNDNKVGITRKQLESTPWFNKNIDTNNHFWGETININGSNVLPLIRIIKDTKTSNEIGLVQLNIEEKNIYNLYQGNQLNKSNITYLLNKDNNIISCYNKSFLGKDFSDIYNDNLNFINHSGYFQRKINGRKYIFVYKVDKDNQWKYINVISLDRITASSNYIKRYTFYICILSIIICLAVSMFLSSRFTDPIHKLINMMDKAESGNLDVTFKSKYNDEIGKLGKSYNNMVARLKKSIDDIFDIQAKKREAEYKAMEFQINPHFLYNTLSSIIWLSNKGENKDVIKMTDSLSKLFRISISKGREVITIREEVEHVKNYLEIQKIRYKDEFECIYDIDENILGLYTIKIILQPLAENALYHGIRDMECKGIIKITAKKFADYIILEVMDNGNALSEQGIKNMNDFLYNDTSDERFGIGIRNVNNRIKFYFKGGYGLTFHKDGIYTIARIKIPVIEEVNDVYNFSGR
ncbi:MAG: histidine kinase [Clostridia bacterium]|nr:histidine kinase [Clostridia bacterium]